MKRALAAALLLLVGAVAAFFLLGPEAAEEPVREVAQSAYSPPPARTAGSAILTPGRRAGEAAGRVVDARGRPVPGAQVFLAREGAEGLASERCDCPTCQKALLECACPAGAAQVAGMVSRREGELVPDLTALADAQGEFRFSEPPPPRFLVWATAPGYAAAFRHGVAAGTRVELALGPAQALWGKVLDEADRPIPGALVTAVSSLLPRFLETTTGPDGAFRLEGLGLGPHFVSATADGLLPAALPLALPAGGPVTLTLPLPRALEGTVREGRGPARNVFVRLNAEHFSKLVPAPEGRFRVEGLAPGRYTATATVGRRFASAQASLEGPLTRVELVLADALAVKGRVFDDAGAPVAEALVTARLDGQRLADVRSGEDGAFALEGVPEGTRLTATKEGYEAAAARVGVEGEEIELVLHAQALVSGVVVSAQGEPLPQVQVIARGAAHGVAVSDASGAFKLALPAPGPVTLLAHHSTYGEGEVSIDAPAEGVTLRLDTKGAVRARLVDPEGRPIAGGRVTAWKDDPALQRFDSFSSDVPSGDDGIVVLAGLPAGPHRVRFTARGFQGAERRNVPIPESGELDLGEVTLEDGKEIAGVVLKDDGTPASGAFVHARVKGSRATEGVPAGKDGTFTLGGLKDGAYTVSAFHEKTVAELTTHAGDLNVVLRLPAPARLRGRVVERDGRPIPRFSVDSTPIDAPDGRFEVPARAWRENVFFRVSAEGHLSAFRQAKLDSAGVADVGDVVLETARSVSGVVEDEAGRPVAGAAVVVGEREELPAQDEIPQRTMSGADGRFRLDGFAPGPVTLLARRGELVGEASFVLEDGLAREVVITLRGKGWIEGVVRAGDGQPVLAEIHTRSASTTSDAQGRYRLDGLVPGTYLVMAVLDESTFRSSSREVQVRSGEATLLDFDLGAGSTLEVRVQGATQGALHLVRHEAGAVGPVRATAAQAASVVDGAASVSGLQAGRYTVYFFGQGASSDGWAQGEVEVPAAGAAELTLTVRPMSER